MSVLSAEEVASLSNGPDSRGALFSSSLSAGDLLALNRLRLEPVAVVQGFDVVRLTTFETFHRTAWFLNRGPGYRPGGPGSLFSSIYSGAPPGWYFGAGTRSRNRSWLADVGLKERAETTPYDERAGKPGRLYFSNDFISENLLRTRRHGIEGLGAAGLMAHCIPGLVFELSEVSGTFDAAYERSHQRLREEAHALGAHGIIGVVDTVKRFPGSSNTEFHLTGTAVRVEGLSLPDDLPWTTYLDAQHLAKLLEVGLMPVEIVTSFSSLLLVMSAYGKWIKSGQAYRSTELPELRKLAEMSLAAAKERAYSKIGSDSLHGVTVDDSVRDSADMVMVRDCLIRGTRVRRFAERDPQPVPISILDLS